MNDKKVSRIRRGKKTRAKIRQMGKVSLLVNKTSAHIYAQIISADGAHILASASTLQANIKEGLKSTSNIAAATKVGVAIAEKARSLGISELAFDRNGFHYHGRVKALADAARDSGLKF